MSQETFSNSTETLSMAPSVFHVIIIIIMNVIHIAHFNIQPDLKVLLNKTITDNVKTIHTRNH